MPRWLATAILFLFRSHPRLCWPDVGHGEDRRRGARARGESNRAGRFEQHGREDFDDGWTTRDDDAPKLTTVLQPIKSTTVIARNDSPDVGFGRSINPYRGCEHGCPYPYVTQ